MKRWHRHEQGTHTHGQGTHMGREHTHTRAGDTHTQRQGTHTRRGHTHEQGTHTRRHRRAEHPRSERSLSPQRLSRAPAQVGEQGAAPGLRHPRPLRAPPGGAARAGSAPGAAAGAGGSGCSGRAALEPQVTMAGNGNRNGNGSDPCGERGWGRGRRGLRSSPRFEGLAGVKEAPHSWVPLGETPNLSF